MGTANDILSKNYEPVIKSVYDVITYEYLSIPDYQRPYSWTTKNVQDLFDDFDYLIQNSQNSDDFKYRIGTILLYRHQNKDKNEEKVTFDIVDGQQRIITLSLMYYCLNEKFENFITYKEDYNDRITITNINKNYKNIKERLTILGADYKQKLIELFKNNLEFVVIVVDELSEAFQLFDSQNSRGKELYPHDLLKAYHLREMKESDSEVLMQVNKWESLSNEDIYNLFNDYLFPIYNWINRNKTHVFTTKDIEIYKGVRIDTGYSYALKLYKSDPIFQLDDFYISGRSFFEYVYHYLSLIDIVKSELSLVTPGLVKFLKDNEKDHRLDYAKNLFFAVLMCYYDKFKILDINIIKLLFYYSFQIRCDMTSLGFSTINKYAIGETNDEYTNNEAIFNFISKSHNHKDIYRKNIVIKKKERKSENETNWYLIIFEKDLFEEKEK